MTEQFDPYYRWLGVPVDQQPPTHYRLLGLEPLEADPEVIGFAADRLSMHVRTYSGGNYAAVAERLLNEIAAARICLLDRKKRADYDARLIAASRAKQEVALVAPAVAQRPPLVGELLPAEMAKPARGTTALVLAPFAERPQGTTYAVAISVPVLSELITRRRFVIAAAVAAGTMMLAGMMLVATLAIWFLKTSTPNNDIADGEAPTTIAAAPPLGEETRPIAAPPVVAPPVITPTVLPPVVLPPVRPEPLAQKLIPLTPAADGTIDLLPWIDPLRDSVAGEWRVEDGVLISQPAYFARLEIPVIPPDEYDLDVSAARTRGNEDLVVGMVYQGRTCGAVLDGWQGRGTGLTVDNGNQGAILLQWQKLITTGEPIRVHCQVRRNSIVVKADDKEFIHFDGAPSWNATYPSWAPRDSRFLLLGTMNSTFEFHFVKLKPIVGQAVLVQRATAPPTSAFAADGSIYLDDYPEVGARLGYGQLGKRGSTGYVSAPGEPQQVKVDGVLYDHALSPHPGPNFPSVVTYDLAGKYRTLTTKVGIIDQVNEFAFGSTLVFQVVGDGRTLWKSGPLTRHGQSESARVDVSGVKRLELIAQCRGPFYRAWSVWLSPQLKP